MGFSPRKELQARRLIAQGLAASAARPELSSPHEVTQHLLALQGQTFKAGVRAIAVRVNNGQKPQDEGVLASIDAHDIVRCWPMRGTLHFVNGEDARWLMRLCSPRVESGASKRRPALGFADGDFEVAHEALNTHLLNLETGQVLARPHAYQLFTDAGIDAGEGRGPHLLRALGGAGDIVQLRPQGRAETFVHVDRLNISQREVASAEALAELGTRYLNGHGPVQLEDLCWWSYLTKKDSKKALESASNSVKLMIGGEEFYAPAWQKNVTEAEMRAALRRTYKLPAFDEYLLGYSNKSFTMPDEIRHEVLTKNGLSWDFTVKNGEVVGRTV